MAHAVNFDTLAYANKLKQAGVPDKQAEAQVQALVDIFDYQAATKKDVQEVKHEVQEVRIDLTREIQGVKTELKRDIQDVETRLTIKMAEMKSDLIRWVVGLMVAQSALYFSFLKFFH